MSAFTPGPWKAKGPNGKYDNSLNTWDVQDGDEDSGCAPITLEDGRIVAFAVEGDGESVAARCLDANARLIAAAPDLYAALSECLPGLIGERMGLLESHCHMDANFAPILETLDDDVRPIIAELDARIAKVRAALAKAVMP